MSTLQAKTSPPRVHNRSVSDSSLKTQAPYSYTLCAAPELCPPHWRLSARLPLRTKFKQVYQKLSSEPLKAPAKQGRFARPAMLRMKDSDDYLTARAANPHTGLISPSVSGSPASRTPGTPGEALSLAPGRNLSESPTPFFRSRPALSRANEGRRVSPCSSTGSARNKWQVADAKGWFMTATGGSSPQVAAVNAALDSSSDRFIVNMPSAREPQPFAYPGRSAEQIESYEHYVRKARFVSGAGSASSVANAIRRDRSMTSQGPVAAAQLKPDCLTVKKTRRAEQHWAGTDSLPCFGGAKLNGSTFAPFSSPRTPDGRTGEPQEMATARKNPAAPPLPGSPAMYRKPVNTLHRTADLHPLTPDNSSPASLARPDLSTLPRVHLVHPERAALPRHRHGASATARSCSLGCTQDPLDGECTVSTSTLQQHQHPLFPTAQPAPPSYPLWNSDDILDLVSRAGVSLITATQYLRLPQLGLLDALSAPDATTQEKVAALKALLSLVGQAVVFAAVATMLWRVGSAAMVVLEVVLWPVVVPFRMLRWMAGTS